MKNINSIIPYLLATVFALALISECSKKNKTIHVPYEVKVQIPAKEGTSDTIIKEQVKLVRLPGKDRVLFDSAYYNAYLRLKDSVQRNNAFKEAIAINEYREVFKDTFQTVEVYSQTRGTLLKQSISYKTKPYTHEVKGSIEVKPRRAVFIGGEIGFPYLKAPHDLSMSPVLKGDFVIQNLKGDLYNASIDSEGRVWVGTKFKL